MSVPRLQLTLSVHEGNVQKGGKTYTIDICDWPEALQEKLAMRLAAYAARDGILAERKDILRLFKSPDGEYG